MADPFSIAAAAIGLLAIAAKIGKPLTVLVHDVKHAEDDLKVLKDDFDTTVSIIIQLKDHEKTGAIQCIPITTVKGFVPIISNLEFTFNRLETLIKKYNGIGSAKASGKVIVQKFRWSYRGKEEALQLAKQLGCQKQTLDLQFGMMDRLISISMRTGIVQTGINCKRIKQDTAQIIDQMNSLRNELLSRIDGCDGVRAQIAAREIRDWAVQTSMYAASIATRHPVVANLVTAPSHFFTAEDHGYNWASTMTSLPVRKALMDNGRYNLTIEGRVGVKADGSRRDDKTGDDDLFGSSLADAQPPLKIVEDETAVMTEDEINEFCLKHVVGLEVLRDVENAAVEYDSNTQDILPLANRL